MDLYSIIAIIIAIAAIYLFIKLVVSPLIKALLGIIILFVALYILQRVFNFDLSQILGPIGGYLEPAKWNINLNFLLDPANHYIDQAKNFIESIFKITTKQ
jgi:hypothetical protein